MDGCAKPALAHALPYRTPTAKQKSAAGMPLADKYNLEAGECVALNEGANPRRNGAWSRAFNTAARLISERVGEIKLHEHKVRARFKEHAHAMYE